MKRKSLIYEATRLSYLDNENKNSKTLIFCHANGYSAGCYQYYFKRLGKDYRIVGIDFFNHGESENNMNFSNWDFYRNQVLAVIEKENLTNIIGVGHSMGGAVILRSVYHSPEKFLTFIGLDPTFLNWFRITYSRLFDNPLAKMAKKRRTSFKSASALERIFQKHPLMKNWDPEILHDYIDSCYKIKNDRLTLYCSPDAEAKNFSTPDYETIRQAYKLKIPSYYILPRKSQVLSLRLARKVARKNKRAHFINREGINHHFPFEEPDWTLGQIEAICTSNSNYEKASQ